MMGAKKSNGLCWNIVLQQNHKLIYNAHDDFSNYCNNKIIDVPMAIYLDETKKYIADDLL